METSSETSSFVNLNIYNENIQNEEDFYYITDGISLEVSSLPSIQFLYLRNGSIKELPENFFLLLTNIKWLDLRDNSIRSIPNSIKNHKTLETLLLTNNQISRLPTELCTVKKLKYLQLSGNPIVFPKYSIIGSGINSLKKYLRFFYNKDNNVENEEDLDEEIVESNEEVVNNRKSLVRFVKTSSESSEDNDNNNEANQNSIDQLDKADKKNCRKETVNAVDMKLKCSNSDRYVKRPRAWSKFEMTRRIKLKAKEEAVLERKIKELDEIETVLQGRKTKEELKNWRDEYKKLQNKIPKRSVVNKSVDLTALPYGTDDDRAKFMTRKEVELVQETLNKRKKYGTRDTRDKREVDGVKLQNKIKDVEKCLTTIEINGDTLMKPMEHQRAIAGEMKKLMVLQKTISRLKFENENIP